METQAKQPRKRTWRRRLMTYLLIVVGLYVVYCTLLCVFQHRLIFPAALAGQAQPIPVYADAVKLTVDTDEGTSVGWFIPAAGASVKQPGPMVVFFHGNAELVDHQHAIVDLYLSLGVSVLLPEYRGYGGAGGSEGSPSQSHLVEDAVGLYDLALGTRGEIDPERVVIHGRSIGGGVAAQVAARRPCAAVIVESTGTSVARKALGFGVPPFIVRSPFYTARVFRGLDVPVLIMHTQDDEIFPYQHARDLLAAAPNGVLVPFSGGHNGLPSAEEAAKYEAAVAGHLRGAGVLAAEGDAADGTPGGAAE